MMCRDQCPWGGPRAVAAALGVVGSVTQPPRPLPDPLRVGGEADIVRTPVALNPGLLGNQPTLVLRNQPTLVFQRHSYRSLLQ